MEQVKQLPNAYLIPGLPVHKHLDIVQLFDGKGAFDVIINIVSIESTLIVARDKASIKEVKIQDITGKSRKREIVRARHLTMYFCAELLSHRISLADISLWIRNYRSKPDHSSIIHGRDIVKDALNKDMRGAYAESILELHQIIDNRIKQIIYEGNCTYWQSRQR